MSGGDALTDLLALLAKLAGGAAIAFLLAKLVLSTILDASLRKRPGMSVAVAVIDRAWLALGVTGSVLAIAAGEDLINRIVGLVAGAMLVAATWSKGALRGWALTGGGLCLLTVSLRNDWLNGELMSTLRTQGIVLGLLAAMAVCVWLYSKLTSSKPRRDVRA